MSTTPATATRAAAPPHDPSGRGDRWLIFAQLLLGAALIVFGALLAALTRAAIHDVGMAVIGIGATLLPAGTAASATGRIHQRYAAQLAAAHPAPAPPAESGTPGTSAPATPGTGAPATSGSP